MWPLWLLTCVMNNITPSICISPSPPPPHSAGTSGVVNHSCAQYNINKQMDIILGHTDVNTLCERKMTKTLIISLWILHSRLRIQKMLQSLKLYSLFQHELHHILAVYQLRSRKDYAVCRGTEHWSTLPSCRSLLSSDIHNTPLHRHRNLCHHNSFCDRNRCPHRTCIFVYI